MRHVTALTRAGGFRALAAATVSQPVRVAHRKSDLGRLFGDGLSFALLDSRSSRSLRGKEGVSNERGQLVGRRVGRFIRRRLAGEWGGDTPADAPPCRARSSLRTGAGPRCTRQRTRLVTAEAAAPSRADHHHHGSGTPRQRKTRVLSPPREQASEISKTQLVVVEEGARAQGLPERQGEPEQTAVVAQTQGESALELVERAIHRIATIERSPTEVSQVSVLLGPDCDEQTMAARRLLGCAVLAYANASRRPCELVFVGRWEDRELRRQLWELVEALVTEPGSAKVPIRLRFSHRAAGARA